MHKLLSQYGGKLSWNNVLRAPPNEGGNGGGASGGSGGDDPNGGAGDSNNGGGDGNGDDDDPDLSEGLGLSGDADDDSDLDFNIDSDEYQQTPEDQAAATALGEKIKTDLAAYSLDDADIPADFDPNDREQVKNLLVNSQRKVIASTMQMMIPVINHALSTASKQMKHQMASQQTGSESRSKAVNAFKELGLSDPAHVTLGKTLFKQAMSASGNDHTKAQKAVRNALRAMGIETAGKSSGNGGKNKQGSQSSGIVSGPAALDKMFEGF